MNFNLKMLLKSVLPVLLPSGIKLKTPLENLNFNLTANFIGYRNFASSKHNAQWAECLKNVKDKVFFDVGAHIGLYSIPASKLAKKVIAFEPSQKNILAFKKNMLLNNNPSNIQIEPYVVSEQAGEISFFENNLASNPKNSILQSSEIGIERKIKTFSLDEYVQKNQLIPDIIKIDVEGAEYLVLKGAKSIMLTNKPKIYLSLHPRQIKQLGYPLSWLNDFAKEVNYQVIPANFASIESLQEVQLHPKEK